MLRLERASIETFRATARSFHRGEEHAGENDVVALMVLRHYGVPTRLLDWSGSPFVAAHFATNPNENGDGAIWAFDRIAYEKAGKEQWRRWPQTTRDTSGNPDDFDPSLTAFCEDAPPWFVCTFYNGDAFPRHRAQRSAYSMTAHFGVDHAAALAWLLPESTSRCVLVVPETLKTRLRENLRDSFGIWEGSLYPDSAGAARFANDTLF